MNELFIKLIQSFLREHAEYVQKDGETFTEEQLAIIDRLNGILKIQLKQHFGYANIRELGKEGISEFLADNIKDLI